MNRAIAFNTFHRILTRPMVLVVLAAHVMFVLFVLIETRHPQLGMKHWEHRQFIWIAYTWALGAGLIGRDFSDGILPLIFSRPVSRAEYLVSRWLGLLAAVAAVMAMDALLNLAFIAKVSSPDWAGFFAGFLISLWLAAASAALLTFFSCLAPSHGDLGLFLGGWLLCWVVSMGIDDRFTQKILVKVFALALVPGVEAFDASGFTETAVHCLIAGLQGAACLFGAVMVMRNREISYVMAS